jgi:hypothetical protein
VKVSTNKKNLKHLSLKNKNPRHLSLSFDDSKYKNERAPFAISHILIVFFLTSL